jgi:hypothetical protein
MSSILSPQRRSQIAAALAAHGGSTPLALSYEARSRTEYGVSDEELARNRDGYSEDPRTEMGLRFAHAAFVTRGLLDPKDVHAACRRGATGDDLRALAALAAQIAGEIILTNLTIEHMFDTLAGPCRSSASGFRRSGWPLPG